MTLDQPLKPVPGGIDIRFRHPQGRKIRSVEINGKPLDDFEGEYVRLKNPPSKKIEIRVSF
jgi:hypothetical protein